jgi:hypothetical protein
LQWHDATGIANTACNSQNPAIDHCCAGFFLHAMLSPILT